MATKKNLTDNSPVGKAGRLLELRENIKKLQQEEETIVCELREHVRTSGEKDFGGIIAYEKTNSAKLEGLENKALKVAVEQLINSLDATYVKKQLDVGKMYAALQTDKSLLGHLAEKGLKITQGSDIYFKSK